MGKKEPNTFSELIYTYLYVWPYLQWCYNGQTKLKIFKNTLIYGYKNTDRQFFYYSFIEYSYIRLCQNMAC